MLRVQLIRVWPRGVSSLVLQPHTASHTRISQTLALRCTTLSHSTPQLPLIAHTNTYHTQSCKLLQNSNIYLSSPSSAPLHSSTPAAAAASSSPADELNHQSARKHNQEYPEPTRLVKLLSTLAIFPVIYFVFDNIVGVSGVRGTSMQPTLNPSAIFGHITNSTNDVALVWKLGKSSYKYERGEVVVMTSPTNPKVKTVKRLIGLEGDWVRDQTNPDIIVRYTSSVFTDACQISFLWTKLLTNFVEFRLALMLLMIQNVVPRGRVWIEGDNAHTSKDDSRQLGSIPLGLLEGKVKYVVWPMARFGPVKKTLDPAGGDERVARRAIQPQ